MTPWRNGSASDSRSEGCVFESRRGHTIYLFCSYSFVFIFFPQYSSKRKLSTHQVSVAVAVEDPEDVVAEHLRVPAGEDPLEEAVEVGLGEPPVGALATEVLKVLPHGVGLELGVLGDEAHVLLRQLGARLEPLLLGVGELRE